MQQEAVSRSRSNTRRIVFDAIFAAVFFLVASVPPFTWKLGIIEFSLFVTLPILLASLCFSLADGVLVALVGSFLEQLVSPYGLAPNTPLWMAPVILQALFFGIAFLLCSKKDCLWKEDGKPTFLLLAIVLCGELLLTALNTGALYLDGFLYRYPVKALHLLALPKLANCALRAAVTLVFCWFLLPKMKKLLDSRKNV